MGENSACMEVGCPCSFFTPNIFQVLICSECFHVKSKHGGLRDTSGSSMRQKKPQHRSLKKISPPPDRKSILPKKYPAIRTISDRYRKMGGTGDSRNQKPFSLLTTPHPTPEEPIKLKSPTHIKIHRANTNLNVSQKPDKPKDWRRETTTFVNSSQKKNIIRNNTISGPPMEPAPAPPTELPQTPKTEPYRPIGHSFDIGNIDVSDLDDIIESSHSEEQETTNEMTSPKKNTKRYAIRHMPSANYQDMFKSSPTKNVKLERMEKTLKIDPRKKRSGTDAPSFARKRRSSTDISCSLPLKIRKRRSSLPLGAKLGRIGIQIPSYSLLVYLHEPGYEVRMMEFKIDEAENVTVSEFMHQLSHEMKSMKSSLTTHTVSPQIQRMRSETDAPSKSRRKRLLGSPMRFLRKKSFEEDNPTPKVHASSKEKLTRIKDFGLFWTEKEEWLDSNRDLSFYCFRDKTILEFKGRVRNFKLRVKYEVKLTFPQFGFVKRVHVTPHEMKASDIRTMVISWVKEENLMDSIALSFPGGCDETLSQFDLYLHGVIMDQDKNLSTLHIQRYDEIEIKNAGGYSIEIVQEGKKEILLISLPRTAQFTSIGNEIIKHFPSMTTKDLTITLDGPRGRLDNLNFGLSRALLQRDETFLITAPNHTWHGLVVRTPKDSEARVESRVPPDVLLDGEIVSSLVTEHVTIFLHIRGQEEQVKYSGTLMISNYRILLEQLFQGCNTNWIQIPLTSVSHIVKVKSKDKDLRKHCLDIFCKDIRKVTIGFVDTVQKKSNYHFLLEILARHIPSSLFAYAHGETTRIESEQQAGWDIYDTKAEYGRMGILTFNEEKCGWRMTSINRTYKICASYPSLIAVPAPITDATLIVASKFRTKNRLPTLSWIHPLTGAVLFRSSQPKVGLQRNTSKEDQTLLQEIAAQGTSSIMGSKQPILHIFDARPIKAAVGNTVMGAGYESDDAGYRFCRNHFLNIDNIHCVRESFGKLYEMCISLSEDNESSHWLQELELTNWLTYISRILIGADRIASLLMARQDISPVLIHCSDGWDRTSQLSSLAQLLVDPYFRSLHGFQKLICKEWLSIGHQFAYRTGHNYGGKEDPEQKAPIFLQFLDCVFQLTIQFPTDFEFNESLLIFVHEEVLNCRFGTFLMGCERERKENFLSGKTKSIWGHISEHQEQFLNPFFTSCCSVVDQLFPHCAVANLHVWKSYYLKYIDFNEPPKLQMERKMKELQRELADLKNKK